MSAITNLKIRSIITVFVLVTAAPTFAGSIIYVDADAAGANDGSSWGDAFNYLQDALTAAWSGDEICVAQGIYKPDQGAGITPGDREETFQLINGVTIKGGYAGAGTPDPNARDIEAHETILTGDLNGDDVEVANPADLLDDPCRADNSYHVVTGSGSVLDGFTITGGNASGYSYGGGLYYYNGPIINCTISGNSARQGGGLYGCGGPISNCTITANAASGNGGGVGACGPITNCIISNNYSARDGGGIDASDNPSPISNNTITRNRAQRGGAIFTFEDAAPTIINNTISHNYAEAEGGAISCHDNSPPIIGNLVVGNTTAGNGGGIYLQSAWSQVTNNTIAGNRAASGGGICGGGILTNCIVWGNSDSSGMGEPAQICGGGTINYTCVQGWSGTYGGVGNIGDDPCFVEPGYWDADSVWIDGDYHLLPDSPCINTGDPNYVPEPGETDLDGKPRIIGGTVDMGVYEFWCPRILYVDDDAPNDPGPGETSVSDPLENGTQAHPFDAIQETIDGAYDGDTVTVLDGTYTGTGNRDIDFFGKAITVRSENGPESCIIDCQGSQTEHHRGFHFHNEEGIHSVLEGVSITGGFSGSGAGISCSGGSPTITNCVITRNATTQWGTGGGMWSSGGSPTLTNCTFSSNRAYNGGGIVLAGGSPTLIKCTIIGNWGGLWTPDWNYGDEDSAGGGVYCSCPAKFIDCAIAGNSAGYGVGIFDTGGSSIFVNCLIYGNWGYKGGGLGCYWGTPPILSNCLMASNLAAQGADGVSGSAILTNSIVWANGCAGGMEASYSCIQGGWAGEGNIDEEPLFVHPGVFEFGRFITVEIGGTEYKLPDYIVEMPDYHLLWDSPCIDAGDPDYVSGPNETDLDGKPRIIGGRIDMGAYEYRFIISAEARILPQTINLASKGNWITCYIWLPDQYNVADIDPNSIFLKCEIEPDFLHIDEQGQIVTARFTRKNVQPILEVGDINLKITGKLTDGTVFEATDVIKVTDRASKKAGK